MKLFIIVRNDLDPIYRMVQGMHSVAKISSEITYDYDKIPIVVLRVRNEEELQVWKDKIRATWDFGEAYYNHFIEPDLNNQLTSVACLTEEYDFFKSLQLVK